MTTSQVKIKASEIPWDPNAPYSNRQKGKKLTIGMSTFDDYDGVYFTVQALRMYHDTHDVEILVVDNYGCKATKSFIENWTGGRYLRYGIGGTSAPRNLVFQEASADIVMCLDCHVFLVPGCVSRLKKFYADNPHCQDLIQGPLILDCLKTVHSHWDPVWRDHMFGTWAEDQRVHGTEPFEIPLNGLGLFSCRKDAWLGFNPKFSGFGGEEGYIHEKFRQAGRRCLCLPWLKWMHRFERTSGQKYQLILEDRIRNYLIGHHELNLDIGNVLRHFNGKVSKQQLLIIATSVLGPGDYEKHLQ